MLYHVPGGNLSLFSQLAKGDTIMTIIQIQCFCAVVKYGGFSQAAEMLFMSQSAVSKHISALEADCGFPLIIRNRKKGQIDLSIEGQLMLRDCNKLIADYDQLLHLRNEMRKKPIVTSMSFSLMGVPEMAYYGIVASINKFSLTYPNTSIHLIEADELYARLALISNEADIAFTSDINLDHLQFNSQKYCEETLSILVSNDSPLAIKNKVYLSDLEQFPLIVGPKKTNLFDFCLNSCKNVGFEPKFSFLTSRPSIALDFIKEHPRSVFIASTRLLEPLKHSNANFCVVDIANSPTFNYALIWKRGKSLSEKIKLYLRLVAEPSCNDFLTDHMHNNLRVAE